MTKTEKRKQQCRRMMEFYHTRAFVGDRSHLEPSWMLRPFNQFDDYLNDRRNFDDEEIDELDEMLAAMKLKGEYDSGIFGKRWIEDGFKVGTTSWLFMGRNFAEAHVSEPAYGLVCISRTVSPTTVKAMQKMGVAITKEMATVYAVYSTDIPHTERMIGPCLSPDDAIGYIPIEFPMAVT